MDQLFLPGFFDGIGMWNASFQHLIYDLNTAGLMTVKNGSADQLSAASIAKGGSGFIVHFQDYSL